MTVWFGPEESPLFGALHLPDAPARGAVVLCPPFGREYSSSHSTFRELAIRLAELGFAALRLDYRSTGDSFERVGGPEGDGFVRDVRYGVDFARGLGVAQVGVVGMRLGATLAAARCRVEPAEALVLWDPCPTGRSFLREQRALGLLVGTRTTEPASGSLEAPGYELSADMTSEISGLDLLTGEPGSVAPGELARKVLLLTRSGRASDRKLAVHLGQSHVEQEEVSGQPELLEVQPPRQAVPTDALATVAAWLDEVMPGGGHVIAPVTPPEVIVAVRPRRTSSSDPVEDEAVPVRERAVRLGPVGLFGIETEPVTGAQDLPVCILVSIANEHRIGPGRLWVKLSRELAVRGLRCVRVDVDGFGDSPARPGRLEQSVHSVDGMDDIVDAARAVSPEDPGGVVLIGHSSSGYLILEAALSLSPRGVCCVNPFLVFQPSEMAAGAGMDDRRRFCLPRTAFATAVLTAAQDRTVLQRLDQRYPMLSSRLRQPLRRVTWLVRRIAAPLRNRPGDRLGDLLKAGTDVLLICGTEEFQPFLETGVEAVRRAGGRGLQIEVIPTLEHSLLPARDREAVSDLILAHVLGRFRIPPPA